MKEVWMCRWEVIPGNGEQTEQFPTLAAAKQAMRQKIAENIDLTEYLGDLEPQVATFLGQYLSDPQFPQSKSDVPEEYEDPERGALILDSGFIRWDYPYDAFPRMNTNLVLDDVKGGDYTFNFWYEAPDEATGNGAKELSITISSHMDYGTSAYPLMVLFALRDYPQTQERIARTISETWDISIDRKAIGRHLQLLQDMGYPVQHGLDGYYYDGETQTPKTGIKYSPSAYPLLILQVLDKTPQTKAGIIRAVQNQYDTKIDRKAVGRHLELLHALGYHIQECADGYYING